MSAFVAALLLASAGQAGQVDLGMRLGYARPVGAFQRGLHAGDVSYGGLPLAIDGTVRVGPPARWSVALGGYFAYAATIPTLCGSASECFGSLGRDVDLALMVRLRAPRLAFVLPEAEVASGWTWSSRSLEDNGVSSTRTWSGPLLLRFAFVPSVALGEKTRLGLVLGGSLAASSSGSLRAPGIEKDGVPSARVHGTFDLGLRFAIDFGD